MESIAIDDGVDRQPAPTLAQAFVVWLRIGLLSFGGPAAQIALMHREVVDIKGKVVYTNRTEEDMFGSGIEFVEVKQDALEILRKYIKEFHNQYSE